MFMRQILQESARVSGGHPILGVLGPEKFATETSFEARSLDFKSDRLVSVESQFMGSFVKMRAGE